MTRASKFTPERAAQAIEMARQGEFRTDICDLLKIGRQTWYDWLKRGELEDETGEPVHPEEHAWLLDLRAAEAFAKSEGILEVRTAVNPQKVQGTVWWLERRWPRDLARRLKTEHMGEDGGPVQMQHGGVVILPAADADPASNPVGAEPRRPDPVSGEPRG